MTLDEPALQRYLRAPELDRSELARQIADFVQNELGIAVISDAVAPARLSAKFRLRMDASNRNVEAKPYVDGMREWAWWFFVSCRAPLITCLTYDVQPVMEQAERRPGTLYVVETTPRPHAVEWTRRIAQRFALQYVDAEPLRKMRVEYEDVAPDFDGAMDHDPDFPNAFQVLFLEY